uniref:Odorant receptor n=1 Tax=Trichogramma kaykai TaxID=54128 RepID=A0ABD2X509_9HYME
MYIYPFLLWNYDKVISIVVTMKRILEENDAFGRIIVKNSYEKLNAYGAFISTLLVFMGMGFSIGPAAIPIFLTWIQTSNETHEKSLPIHTEFFIDEDKYFYQLYALHVVVILLYIIVMGALSSFLFSAIEFIIGELHYLQNVLDESDVEYKSKLRANKLIAHNFIINKFKFVIHQHQNCIT